MAGRKPGWPMIEDVVKTLRASELQESSRFMNIAVPSCQDRGSEVVLRDHRSQNLLLAAGVLLLAFSHWLIGGPDKHFNNLLYNVNFVPILVGGMLLGWRTAVFATLLTLAAEMPHLYAYWPNDETYRMDQIFETLSSGVGGVAVGLLASKERRHRAKLEVTTRELAAAEPGTPR